MKNSRKRYMLLARAAFLGLLLAAGLYALFFHGKANRISYSEFRRHLDRGFVTSVEISPDTIRGSMDLPDDDRGAFSFSTVRVEDPELIANLENRNVDYAGKPDTSRIQGLLSTLLPLALLFAVWFFILRRGGMTGGMGGTGLLRTGQSRAKLATPDAGNRVTFADVAGIDEVKEELQEVVEFLKVPRKFEELGGRIPKGVLLVGAPGTGKTLLAKAVSGEAGVPFFSISGSEFVEMFVGVGAARVRDLFTQATAKAPCIVFIDELDALGKARGAHAVGGHDEREQTLNQLLVEMDGFDTRKGVIVMAATNRPEILDPALLRPGRFDRQIAIGRPDLNGREAILRIHTRNVKLAEYVDLRRVAAQTSGFAGADLANMVNEAALLAARRGKRHVGMKEFEEALERVVAGLEKKRVITPKEKSIVAFHEAGHALAAASVPNAEPVHKISIVPRGIAALGYTMQFPLEDRYLLSRRELEDRLAVLMGGRAAEELIFGDVTTGAQNDLVQATDTARAMVTRYGMSRRLGMAVHEKRRGSYLGGDQGESGAPREYSEEVASVIDEEIREILEQSYSRVKGILEERRELLDRIAELLLEKESIDREEFEALVRVPNPLIKTGERTA